MATTDTYKIVVDGSQAERSLKSLQTSLEKTNGVFAGLRNAIGGLAIGAFITNAYNMANAVTDMATAAGVSTQALLGFRDAVAANGGEAQGAIDGLARFAKGIDDAATGSKSAQDNFLRLGITLNDLRTLSEQDLMRKAITGLSQINDNATRSAIGMELFGKSFKSVDFAGVARDINTFTQAAGETAEGINAAGQASQNFKNAYLVLQSETLKALKPLSELSIKLTESAEAVKSFINTVFGIAAIALSFTVVGKAISLLRIAFASFALTGGAVATMIASVRNSFTGFQAILQNLSLLPLTGQLRVLGTLLGNFGKWLIDLIPALTAVGTAVYWFRDQLASAYDSVKEFFGLSVKNDEAKRALEEQAKMWADFDAATEEYMQHRAKQINETARLVTAAGDKERVAMEKVLSSYKDANTKANEKYNLDTLLIGATLEQRTRVEELTSAQDRYTQQLDALKNKYEELKANVSSPTDQAAAEQIRVAMEKLTKEAEKQIPVIQKLVAERIKADMQQQATLFLTQQRIDLENKLKKIQDDIATSTMPELAKQYYVIEAAAKAAAKAAIDAEEARIGRPLNVDEQKAFYKVIEDRVAKEKQAAKESYEHSRKFETGWKQAFNSYVENATNAAEQARQVFQKVTQGMEDMIINFAKTGKFEFNNFINSIVEMLLRSEIQQTMAKIFQANNVGSAGSGGNIFSAIGKMLGFANGGMIPTNQPVLVGERGPEILTGAAGRTVIPNHELGGTNVTYNINAVDARSFQQLVAQNPEFIYAVTLKGQRSMPGGR